MQQTYVGSQPIYNKDLKIHAYQLLFHSSKENKASFDNGDQATSEIILHSLTDIGLDKLIGTYKTCINFTRKFILGEYPIPNLKNRIIVELQEGITVDQTIIDALHGLSAKGFTLAMPESLYLAHFNTPSEYRYIVKFDINKNDIGQLPLRIENIQADNVRVLAEKVETQAEYAACNELDFDYLQGFFFCLPNIVKGVGIPGNKLQLIRLLNKLHNDETDSTELEQLISLDVNLSYRLLRYANSSHLGLNTRIESIQHAVTLLGWDTIKMITTLLALSSVNDKPPELFLFGLIRAKMCEYVSKKIDGIDENMAFAAGLLSIIDALLDASMEEILAQLPLNNILTQALLGYEGELGHLLHDCTAYVHSKQEEALLSGISSITLRECYLKSLVWAKATAPEFATN